MTAAHKFMERAEVLVMNLASLAQFFYVYYADSRKDNPQKLDIVFVPKPGMSHVIRSVRPSTFRGVVKICYGSVAWIVGEVVDASTVVDEGNPQWHNCAGAVFRLLSTGASHEWTGKGMIIELKDGKQYVFEKAGE